MNEQTVLWRSVVHRLVPRSVRAGYWRLRQALESYRLLTGRGYEPAVSAALKRHIRPGATCLDVGANVGLLTVLMAHLAGPRGRVHAFEAHPRNVVKLKDNVVRYRVGDRVTVHHAAVTDGRQPTVRLYGGRNQAMAEWNILGHDVDGHATEAALEIAATSLDRCMASRERVDVVKIDVEGAEGQVLAGMERILRHWSPVLIIECHSQANWRTCGELGEQGYRLCDLTGAPVHPGGRLHLHFVALPRRRVSAAG